MTLMADKPRGILNPRTGEKMFRLTRHLPSEDLSFFIEHYWNVKWDLTGQPPYLQENLPDPSVHLVFNRHQTAIFGVVTKKFGYRLEGRGQVLGIKFKPGAFYPFIKRPVSAYTDKIISLQEVFGADYTDLEEQILALENLEKMVELAEFFLRSHLPEKDETVELVNQIVECISANREITMVSDLLSRVNISERTLQRIFNQYVGVSPKWVIKRKRLMEAAEQVATSPVKDWSRLATELGYFDQAHFIKDFKTIVGRTPAEYARHIEAE
ncbi:MAG TPA: helix-turn-helix domain-containing protein [Chloroflexia bacterium]|nr:helix-turn-helix domain-containing protein [Chloroflexia bacterium]